MSTPPRAIFAMSTRASVAVGSFALAATVAAVLMLAPGVHPGPQALQLVGAIAVLAIILLLLGGVWGLALCRADVWTWVGPALSAGIALFVVATEPFLRVTFSSDSFFLYVSVLLLMPFAAGIFPFLRVGNILAAAGCWLFFALCLALIVINSHTSTYAFGFRTMLIH